MYLADYNISTNTLFTGKTVVYLPTCLSTNDVAASLARLAGTAQGTVVWAGQQTAGRGQQGNHWQAEPGQNLTCSFVLYPRFLPLSQAWYLAIVAALAVHNTLSEIMPDQLVQIKWPNDVLVNGKKCCGILIENQLEGQRLRHSITGIGINVGQTRFDMPTATSIALSSSQTLHPGQVLEKLCHHLEGFYLQLQAGRLRQLKARYEGLLAGTGEWRVFLRADGTAVTAQVQGVSNDGRLQLLLATGAVELFDLKEISWCYDQG